MLSLFDPGIKDYVYALFVTKTPMRYQSKVMVNLNADLKFGNCAIS